LNGASTEAFGVMAEALSSMIGGIILAFVFSWKVALIAIAMTPFMIVGAIIGSKIDQQVNSGS
jgi:ABC-type multidrug transport system fused ATPase/permease subunit